MIPVAAPVAVSCQDCGTSTGDLSGRCPRCQGLVGATYEPSAVAVVSRNRGPGSDALDAFWPLLPVPDRELCRIPVPPTPLSQVADLDGVPVFAKVEGVLPTGSTKDRLVSVSLALMLARGVRRFVFSSTGNTAAAYAWGLQWYPELSARAYVSSAVPASQLGPPVGNLQIVRVDGDYVEAGRRSRAEMGPDEVHEDGFFNLGRREGAKLAYLEAFAQLDAMGHRVDTVVQAVASGIGIVAAARAAEQSLAVASWGHPPRLVCVQQCSCAPMVRAYQAELAGGEHRHAVASPYGLAASILLGDPFASYDYVAHEVRRSQGAFVDVSSSEIADVLRRHARQVPIGESAAVGLAGAYRLWEQGALQGSPGVLVLLTGGPRR